MAKRLRAWWPAAAWAGFLFLLSMQSDLPGPRRIPYGDKIGHFLLYAVLGVLLARGRHLSNGAVPHLLLLVAGALYGVSDEWHQMYVPGRVPDVSDWLADVAGLSAGYGVAMLRWNRPTDTNEHEAEDSA